MADTYEYTNQYGDTFNISFYRSRYIDNGRPYVGVLCEEEPGWWDMYADATVNIWAPLTAIDGYHVHMDTNNCRHLYEWMVEKGFVKPTGLMGQSGWCEYPEVELDHEWYDALDSCEEE